MTGFKQVKLDEKGRGQIKKKKKKKKKEKKVTCKTAAELAVKNRPTLHWLFEDRITQAEICCLRGPIGPFHLGDGSKSHLLISIFFISL